MDNQRANGLFAQPAWTTATRVGLLVAVIAGLVVSMTVQLTLGWWLDSGQGVAVTTLTSFVATLVLFRAWYQAVAFWAALLIGNLVILFSIGPGSIFPIVIVIGGTLTAGAVLAGWGLRCGLDHAWSTAGRWLHSS